MKVYVLEAWSLNGDIEIYNVYDSLEKAQSWNGSKPEDWAPRFNEWTKIHEDKELSIIEYELL